MLLTVREVATLLGKSPRTVRAQAERGELPALKRGGRWAIEGDQLPLSAPQKRSLQARAQAIRATVEAVLPGRDARTPGDRRRGLGDLDAFLLLSEAIGLARAQSPAEVLAELEAAALALAEAVHLYERSAKLAALDRARMALGRADARLRLAAVDLSDPLLVALTDRVIPAVGGYARWVSRLGRGPG